MSLFYRDHESALKALRTELLAYDPLTDDALRDLCAQAQCGDARAAEQAVRHSWRLAFKIALGYHHPRVDVVDLIQEALIGLAVAVRTFHVTADTQFTTYAGKIIRSRIERFINRTGHPIRHPERVVMASWRIRRLILNLRQHGLVLTPELLTAAGCAPQDIDQALRVLPNPCSLDELLEETRNEDRFVDECAADDPERMALTRETLAELRQALDNLSPLERQIIGRLYGLEGEAQSLRDVSADLRMSLSRVMRIKHRALRELRRLLGGNTGP